MRIYLCWLVVFALMAYAMRNYFVSLCGLILLSVVMQRRDFPQYLMGINGLNPWNLLFLTIVLAWLADRIRHPGTFDLPRPIGVLLLVGLLLLFISYFRAAIDLKSIPAQPMEGQPGRPGRPDIVGFTGEFLINRIKFVLPAVILFDACRTPKRILAVIMVIAAAAFAYAVLVIKTIPLHTLLSDSEDVFMRYRHRIDRDVGLMAIDMSMLFAGTFWAVIVYVVLIARRPAVRLALLGTAGAIFLAMTLCHSRGSYFGFAAAGLMLGIARWRKLLLLLPVGGGVAFIAFPAIPARLGMGVGVRDVTGQETQDWDTITAGRSTDLWPAAIEQIGRNPLIGFGGIACRRTELRQAWEQSGGAPAHPHNAYLELMLDMGLVGLVPFMMIYLGIWALGFRLFQLRNDPLAAAVGGMTLASVTTLLATALGAQSFYPTQSTLLYWCVWALCLRAVVAREHARRRAAIAPFQSSNAGPIPAMRQVHSQQQ